MTVPVSEPAGRSRPALARAWVGRLGTAVALVALAGLAYLGHRTEWRFLSPTPREEPAKAPDTMWVEAKPGPARPCAAHGLPLCPVCDPQVAEVRPQPTPTAADRERIERARAVRERSLGAVSALRLPRSVVFASTEAVDAAGIGVEPAWVGPVTETVGGSAELGFDPVRFARLGPRAAGTAWRVFGRIGDRVRAGDVLALIDAAEVGRAKAELQVALVDARLRAQAVKDLTDAPIQERQRQEAQAALRNAGVRVLAAEQALVNLGFPVPLAELRTLPPVEVADRLQRLGLPADMAAPAVPVPATLLPVRAPWDGALLNTDVVAGEAVEPSKVLFVLANPDRLRLTIHLSPEAARWVRVGQEARFRPDGGAPAAVGRVTWVGVVADETTRTVPVWADVPNPDGKLRVFTLGTGRVVLREEPTAVVVPAGTVQTVGGVSVAFVRDRDYFDPAGPKAFHTRPVLVGATAETETEIIAGVWPGEVVATKGSAVLADAVRKSLGIGR